MSSSEDSSEDSHDYESYDEFDELDGPPLVKTKSRLIAAVVGNKVDVLRDLLDSPKWYNVRDRGGYNLLQIAILCLNKEVFDYLMSIPDFPLEFDNGEGQSELVDFLDYGFDDHEIKEHFAYELVKKGACLETDCFDGNTPLHWALTKSYMRVAKLLMDAGGDVNVPNDLGKTPLDLALESNNITEEVTALLIYGAEPSWEQFTRCVMHGSPFLVQESLFLYLCDEYSAVEIDLQVLLKLAEKNSPLFHEIIKFSVDVEVSDYKLGFYFRDLCSISVEYLKIIIEKFGPYISGSFAESSWGVYFYDKVISVTNLNMMVDSNMRSDMIVFINALDSRRLLENFISFGYGEPEIEELCCFLLTYGLTCRESTLQLIYQKFGYCELLKILLHMNFHVVHKLPTSRIFRLFIGETNIMAIFIYDVSMNLKKFLAFPDYKYIHLKGVDELFSYFAHPKLKEIHTMADDQAAPARNNLPQIPLLVELSRNAFRKFFIKKFQIKTSRKFFTLLNRLLISPVHKRIITYETKLY